MNCIGLDVGGANVKISDGERSLSRPFPLWTSPGSLADVLAEVLDRFTSQALLAVTMTGELADCFEFRPAGVRFILDALEQAAPKRSIGVWCTAGEFLSIAEAREFPMLVAAANWHALATWGGRMAPVGDALLIDVGSTTTDVIPIENSVPLPAGRTDRERLTAGELVYVGARRTPVCALVADLPLRGTLIPVAREVFATTLDVALLLGHIDDAPDCSETANGRPATRAEAAVRLARQICCDAWTAESPGGDPPSEDLLSEAELISMAGHIRSTQLRLIGEGLRQVLARMPEPPQTILLAGEGEALAVSAVGEHCPALVAAEHLSLTRLLGSEHSRAACAFALSQLGRERCVG